MSLLLLISLSVSYAYLEYILQRLWHLLIFKLLFTSSSLSFSFLLWCCHLSSWNIHLVSVSLIYRLQSTKVLFLVFWLRDTNLVVEALYGIEDIQTVLLWELKWGSWLRIIRMMNFWSRREKLAIMRILLSWRVALDWVFEKGRSEEFLGKDLLILLIRCSQINTSVHCSIDIVRVLLVRPIQWLEDALVSWVLQVTRMLLGLANLRLRTGLKLNKLLLRWLLSLWHTLKRQETLGISILVAFLVEMV